MLRKSPLVVGEREANGAVHSELLQFHPCFLSGPVFDGHAVCRDHHSSAVVPVAAVNEDLLPWVIP